MGKKLLQSEFIERAKNIHNNRYDYSNTIYQNSYEKIQVICPTHGTFIVHPMDHIHAKSGCRLCSGNFLWSTDYFINKSVEIHANLYDYSFVNYKNASTKVEIICKSHGSFFQKPVDHMQGRGCILCKKPETLKKRIEKGQAIDPALKEPFQLYRDAVRKLSNQNFQKYYYDINPTNLRRGPNWHLDHIVSITAGFAGNLPVEEIASPSNLRIISAKENRQKNVFSCDSVSHFDPNNIRTVELGELAHKEVRKKLSNTYRITDLITGQVELVELLVDWCKERNLSVSSVRWNAGYGKLPFHNRWRVEKL